MKLKELVKKKYVVLIASITAITIITIAVGAFLVFSNKQDTKSTNNTSTKPRITHTETPYLAPTKVAYTKGNDIYISKLDGTEEKLIHKYESTDPNKIISSITISPDLSKVSYYVFNTKDRNIFTGELFITINHSNPILIDTLYGLNASNFLKPIWNSSSNALYYKKYDFQDNKVYINKFNLNTGKSETVETINGDRLNQKCGYSIHAGRFYSFQDKLYFDDCAGILSYDMNSQKVEQVIGRSRESSTGNYVIFFPPEGNFIITIQDISQPETFRLYSKDVENTVLIDKKISFRSINKDSFQYSTAGFTSIKYYLSNFNKIDSDFDETKATERFFVLNAEGKPVDLSFAGITENTNVYSIDWSKDGYTGLLDIKDIANNKSIRRVVDFKNNTFKDIDSISLDNLPKDTQDIKNQFILVD